MLGINSFYQFVVIIIFLVEYNDLRQILRVFLKILPNNYAKHWWWSTFSERLRIWHCTKDEVFPLEFLHFLCSVNLSNQKKDSLMREIFRKVSVQKTSRRLLSYFLMSCVKPMFQELNYICLCVSIYNHKQKSYVFYKSCSKRFCNFYKRTTKCQSLFLIKNRLPQRRFPWDL